MSTITLNNITSGYNVNKINDNFTTILNSTNTDLIHVAGGQNTMGQDLDLNSNKLLNVGEVDASLIKLNGLPITTSQFVLGNNVVGQSNMQVGYDTSLTKVSDLASTTTGKGAALVGFKTTGTGTLATTVYNHLLKTLYAVDDFGVVADGTTVNTAAMQAAINEACASNRELVLPPGVIVSGALTIPSSIRMRGAGSGDFAYGGIAASTITKILFTGSSAPMVIIAQSAAGGYIKGLWLECNGVANVGLWVKSVLGMRFEDIYISNYTGKGLWCAPDPALSANCMYNEFHRIHCNSSIAGSTGIFLTGSTSICNTCHNVFYLTRIEFGGAGSYGLIVGNSDNNDFYQTYIFTSGTGVYGVFLKNEYAGFPISTHFFHLQASTLGLAQDTGINDNFIFGYAQDNAQPNPVLNGGRLFYVSTNGGISPIKSIGGLGTKPGSNVAGQGTCAASATTATVTFSFTAEPDTNYVLFITPAWQTTSAITAKTTTGFTVGFGTAPAGINSFAWLLVRTG